LETNNKKPGYAYFISENTQTETKKGKFAILKNGFLFLFKKALLVGIPVMLLCFAINSVIYVDPLHNCYIYISTGNNSAKETSNTIRSSLKILKRADSKMYTTTCKYINIIKDPVTSCSSGVLGCAVNKFTIEVNASKYLSETAMAGVISHEACHLEGFNTNRPTEHTGDKNDQCYNTGWKSEDLASIALTEEQAGVDIGKPIWFKLTQFTRKKFNNPCLALPQNESDKLGTCYFELGQKLNSQTQCLNVKGLVFDYQCWAGVAVKGNDIKLCKDKNLSENKQQLCLSTSARHATSVDFCQGLNKSDSYELDNCIIEIAAGTKNEAMCEQTLWEMSYNKDVCYRAVAINSNNYKLCDKLPYQPYPLDKYNQCYLPIAKRLNDSTICKLFPSGDPMNSCFKEVMSK
jgi:hypothetical protein